MALVSVLDCFQVLVNGIATLIELNLTIFDLTLNLMIRTCIIFETEAIGDILVILHVVCSHFEAINQILSNFYGCNILMSMNWYQSNVIIICMIRVQCIILLTDNSSLMINCFLLI